MLFCVVMMRYVVLCCVMLFCVVMMRYVVLCCVMLCLLCCVMLCYVMLCHGMCYVVLCYVVLFYFMLCYAVVVVARCLCLPFVTLYTSFSFSAEEKYKRATCGFRFSTQTNHCAILNSTCCIL